MTTFSEFVFGHVHCPKTMARSDAKPLVPKTIIDMALTSISEGFSAIIDFG